MKKEPYIEVKAGLLFSISHELAKKAETEGEQVLFDYVEKELQNGEKRDET